MSTTYVVLKRMGFDDIETVKELFRPMSESLSYLPDAALSHYVQSGSSMVAIGEEGLIGALIGCWSYKTRPRLAGILQLGVSKDYHACGVGSALFNGFQREAQDLGAIAIQAWCREDLEANKFWYKQFMTVKADAAGGKKRDQRMLCWHKTIQTPTVDAIYWEPTSHRTGTNAGCPTLTGEKISSQPK